MSRFRRDAHGVTAIEYSLIAGLIAVAIFSAVSALGQDTLIQLFDKVASSL